MKPIIFILASLIATSAAAVDCGESERFGQRLVRVGDSERRVTESAGEPDRIVRLEKREGGGPDKARD